jgi:transcriptional regulator with XRE-family HTH domain
MLDIPSTFYRPGAETVAETVAETEARLGRGIRQLRLEAGFDQVELAARANISRSAVQALEAGLGSRLRTVISVLRALDRLDALESLMPATGPTPLQLLAEARRAAKVPQRRRRVGE